MSWFKMTEFFAKNETANVLRIECNYCQTKKGYFIQVQDIWICQECIHDIEDLEEDDVQ